MESNLVEGCLLVIIIVLSAGIVMQYRAAIRRLRLLDEAVQQMQTIIIGLYEVQRDLDGEWKHD